MIHRVCEVLLDNEKEELYRRASRQGLFEDVVTTSNVQAFTTFAYPLVRRIFPRLIANDLVSVQPMSQPTGKIFYFDILYSPAQVGSPLAYNRVDIPANFATNNTPSVPGYASAAEAAQVPQLSLQIEEVDVSAITRKLSAKWSMESEQDLFAYHGMNAENELMTALGDEIAREIDRDIIDALFAFAGAGNVTWHYTVPVTGSYSLIDPKAYNRTLMDAITDANNLIFKQRYRNASWIVVGTTTAGRLEKLDEFRLFPAADPVGTIVYGPHLFGTISGRWTVYKDPWLDVTGPGGGVGGGAVMRLGYKGTTPLDNGYVYAVPDVLLLNHRRVACPTRSRYCE
jgi:Major capsid protein Gp23